MLRLLESTPMERAAKLTYLLTTGRKITTDEAAELTGITPRSAERTLCLISRIVPIYQDEEGNWMMVEESRGSISPY